MIGSLTLRKTIARLLRTTGVSDLLNLPAKESSVNEYCESYFSTFSPTIQYVIPGSTIINIPPITNTPKVNWKFRQLYLIQAPAAFVLRLDDASVVGESGAIVTKERILLRDISREFGNRASHSLMSRVSPIRTKRIHGRVAVLTTSGANTYYHWMVDILPRFYLLKLAEIDDDIDYYILPEIKYNFQERSLELLGLNKNKIIVAKPDSGITALELFVPSLPSKLGTVSNWASIYLSKLIVPNLYLPGEHKIYVARRNNVMRSFTNENDIRDLVISYGFKVIFAEDYSIDEQASIFHNANVVVAPHGSGLTNIVFCRKGTIVVDLFPDNFIVPCFWTIANSLGLVYHCLSSPVSLLNQYQPYWENSSDSCEFPIDILRNTLNQTIK